MPQSLACLYVHLIFSTKDRRPFLRESRLRGRMHAYLGGIARKLGNQVIIVGGVEDHVHLLIGLGREITIADLVRDLKRNSTLWFREEAKDITEFQWQAGYGAFSVSPTHRNDVERYIRNQEEHHKKEDFRAELLGFLRRYQMPFDEEYLFE